MSEYTKINNLYLSLKKMGLEKEAFEILKIADVSGISSQKTFLGKVINLDSGHELRIRSAPNTKSSILEDLSNGDSFEFFGEEKDGFLKIKAKGVEGWISSAYAEYSDPSGRVIFRGDKTKPGFFRGISEKLFGKPESSSPSQSVPNKPSGGISSPVGGGILITSPYDWRIHPTLKTKKFHYGLDIRARTGTEIKSIEDGIVTHVGDTGAGGNTVIVKSSGSEREWSYMHLSQYKVEKGSSVRAGQVIALSGNSGRSAAPHLHLKLEVGGSVTDPLPTIKGLGISIDFKHESDRKKHG
jgi:hypothetical protein